MNKTALPKTQQQHHTKIVFLLIFMTIQLLTAGSILNAQKPKTSEILWDKYGVPHIYGKTTAEMYYGYGWAQMRNHANLMLKLYGQARGRAAEFWGEEYLHSDQVVHLFELKKHAVQEYKAQSPLYKSYLDAFVAGANAYAKAHPEAIQPDRKAVLPISPYDVLAHTKSMIYLKFLAYSDLVMPEKMVAAPGSNAMAISPSKSAAKHAMLMANPHLMWSDSFTFFEAQLNAPDYSTYGVSLVGTCTQIIAFNDHLGWTHTVNTIDAADRYELSLSNGGYLLDGATKPFLKRTDTIRVRQKNGSLKSEILEFKYALHGPVMEEKNGKAYALRMAGMDNHQLLQQYHLMGKAKNWKEFETAEKMLQIPMFNVIYADQAGNIHYLFGGNVPIRSSGDFAFWNGVIDGTQSKYIWQKTHPYKDLPKLFNPSTGFVQNCNDAPWISTYPAQLNPLDFPAYMAPQEMDLRAQRAVNLVKNNPSITFDQLVAYKLNTGMEAADRFLPALLSAVKNTPDSAIANAAKVLNSWDKQTENTSRGAVLFAAWFDKLKPEMYAKAWDIKNPVSTPSGFKDDQQILLLFKAAIVEVQQKYGSLEVAWGDICRFSKDGVDYPANGGPGEYGIFRTIYYKGNTPDKEQAYFGDSYVAVTEFGPKVRAKVSLSYGNASQAGIRQFDQLKMMSDKQLRDALLDRKEVLQHLEEREVYQP